ncbi:MAG: M23 family metallopeptidase [Mariprofundaceae bacterium]|nr:M23 family metallopeptidase [Mariprofundaceae bacterium]
MHDGIDIAVKDGTPVHAAADGIVVHSSARLSGYGKLIIIRHSDQLFTAYAHNQQLLVKVGDRIRAGQVIAKSGHSGHSTGSHLHFEIRIGTNPVNPLLYLPKR